MPDAHEPVPAPSVRDLVLGAGAGERRRRAAAAWAALAAWPFLRLARLDLAEGRDVVPLGADVYETLIATQSAAHLRQFTGPWSRLGFHHPGPALFYWDALWYRLLGGAPVSITVAAAVLAALCLAGVVAVVGLRMGPVAGGLAVAVAFAFLARADPAGLNHPWNPAATVLATTLLLVVAAAVATGSDRLLPVLVLVGSFVAQTHLGAAPIGVVVTAGVVAWRFRRPRAAWAATRPWTITALVVLAVVWAPVALDQVAGTGNAGTLARYAITGEVDSQDLAVTATDLERELGPWGAVEWAAATSVGLQPDAARWAGSDPALGKEISPSAASTLLFGVLVGANVGLFWWRRRTPKAPAAAFAHACTLAAVSGAVLSVAAALSSRGEFRPYLIAFSVGVGLLLWLAPVLSAAALLRPAIAPAMARLGTGAGRWAPGAAVAVLALLAIPVLRPDTPLFPSEDPAAAAMVAAVRDRLQGTGGTVELTGSTAADYPRLIRMAIDLEEGGRRVQVPDGFRLRTSGSQATDVTPVASFVIHRVDDGPPSGCDPLPVAAVEPADVLGLCERGVRDPSPT